MTSQTLVVEYQIYVFQLITKELTAYQGREFSWGLPVLPPSPLRVTSRNSLNALFFLCSSELGDCGVDESDISNLQSLMHNPGSTSQEWNWSFRLFSIE